MEVLQLGGKHVSVPLGKKLPKRGALVGPQMLCTAGLWSLEPDVL
jgi:hypothetical protein